MIFGHGEMFFDFDLECVIFFLKNFPVFRFLSVDTETVFEFIVIINPLAG